MLLLVQVGYPTGAAAGGAKPATCTYSTWTWNVNSKSAVDHRRVVKPYSELTGEEIDRPTGCTVCEEDQESVEVPPLPSFMICRTLKEKVLSVVKKLRDDKEPVTEIVGYRVGKSSGELDAKGNRLKFSSHSHGIAIDVNPSQNGLYDNCFKFGPQCRLRRGGVWDPAKKGSLKPDGAVVKAMKEAGFRWGGEIPGRQKDFMHFSPSGY